MNRPAGAISSTLANTLSRSEPLERREGCISVLPGAPLGIAWGFLYGYCQVRAENYLPQLRGLGAGFTKVYLFWNQLEPQPGHYDWTAVDAYLEQLQSPGEALISIFSSSEWATRTPALLLPPSPAKTPADYYNFIYHLVKHCQGRVRYWQNDAEPNNPLFWAGTKEEFVAHLKLFYRAVKDAHPEALVLVGGYDGLFVPPAVSNRPPFPMQQAGLDFFDYVLKEGREDFDIFDLRLYGDPYTIVPRVEFMREKMHALGYDKPIFCTEYGGPSLFEFAANRQYRAWVSAWATAIGPSSGGEPVGGNPLANEIKRLYDTMHTLPPETQMFLLGCPQELEAKFHRIQSRGLVMRNVLALSAGVRKTLYWQLLDAHGARNDLMTLMFGKIGMIGYENGAFTRYAPVADTFARMAGAMNGLRHAAQIEIPGAPNIFLFKIDRRHRAPLYVVWERRDAFSGEDLPAVPFSCHWDVPDAVAIDALGEAVPTKVADGRVYLSLSLTPIFLEPRPEVV